jgi:hypothetical protein
MQLLIITAFTLSFPSHVHASDNPSNTSLEWIKNKWTIGSPAFTRIGQYRNPLSSTAIGFKLYYHKWNACKIPAPADPELCGLDLEASKKFIRCSLHDESELGGGPTPWPKIQ